MSIQNFYDACENGNLEVAQSFFHEKVNIKHAFRKACYCGHVKVAKWLLEKNPEIIITDNTFSWVVCSEHLEVAQWLFKIKPNINVSIHNEISFRWACLNGNLEVAQWLLEIKPDINISADDEYAFHWACRGGHVKVAQWLQSLRPWLYKIIINNNDLIPHINTQEEQRFQRRKYMVWLYSLKTKMNKECVFHKLPNELLRAIAMVL